MVVHLVAHLMKGSPADLCSPVMAHRMWAFLRKGFPVCLAAVLMANHLHLIARVLDASRARVRLARAVAAAVRGYGRWTWERIPEPVVLKTTKAIRRDVRYVALNPCRARIVADPLDWPWSTHRDLVGATVAPWTAAPTLAQVLHEREQGFAERFHRYVSSDRLVDVNGTPFPRPAQPSEVPSRSLSEIERAVVSATRQWGRGPHLNGHHRRLLTALAQHQGWRSPRALAELCNTTPNTIRRTTYDVSPDDLRTAALCLGDRRLLRGPWPS